MSKLYQKYMSLKMQDSETLYLFKSGIFYIFLDEDAKLIHSKLNLKLTNLNSMVVKCGFPISKIDKYINLINEIGYSFKIIDSTTNTSYLPQDYILNNNITNLLRKISSVNADELSISETYELIEEFSKEAKNLLNQRG